MDLYGCFKNNVCKCIIKEKSYGNENISNVKKMFTNEDVEYQLNNLQANH